MSATEEQMSPSRITARLSVWLAALLFLLAAVVAVPVSATASAKALCVPQNRTGGNPTAAPFGMLPTIASPDWSKNLFVSNDPAHGISKFLGGQALTTLATAGASELPEALSSGAEEATNLLPGATTGVTDLADAKTATALSEDAVKTPTADAVTAKVPRPTGKATEADVASFEDEGGGQAQGSRAATGTTPSSSRVRAKLAANRAALAGTNLDRLVAAEKNAAENTNPLFRPGPYAGESVAARSPSQAFTDAERAEINRIGYDSGCHTCGTTDPGTVSGNFVPDHQPVSALNSTNLPQRLYPQCINCSREQGLAVARAIREAQR